tara:strand:+ start:101 stop:1447 length:1347 start_codon:yes stop_codon:yes gene_type:complete
MLSKSFNLTAYSKIQSYKKVIEVDPDKSISIRSFLIGAISHNISSVKNVLESEDVFSTIKCLKSLGVQVKKQKSKNYLIYGKGLGSLFAKKNIILNFGNSGTLARLLIGILSTTPDIEVKIMGDDSLNKRSMEKLIMLMSNFGATFLPKGRFFFPLKLNSTNLPIGIKYKAGVSAQLKSAVIFAGLNAYGNTEITEKEKSRDHTENLLKKNSQAIKITNGTEKKITIFGKNHLNSININVPGDPSSAAFFTALTILNKDSSIRIKNVGLNQTRTGFYKILKNYGAKIKFKNLKKKNNELSGDIYVYSSKLKPLIASRKYYVNSTDEYPILFIIAALTKGVSIFEGIKDLANKESNRIIEMQKILTQVGIRTISSKDRLKIYGKGLFDASSKKINVSNLGDHRICMSTFILAVLTGARLKIKNFETVFTSSPSFLKIMKSLGAKFEIQK